MSNIAKPFGLALSGGGFRATAYHLGVLKRLREVGLLGQVDVISTVSGGTIAGAVWVHWQATRGDTLSDQAEWDRFEGALIEFMRFGVRERIVFWTFIAPFGLAYFVTALVLLIRFDLATRWPDLMIDGRIAIIAVPFLACFALAYLIWHGFAGVVFQYYLDYFFFKNDTLINLCGDSQTDAPLPYIVMNATGLNSGDHLLLAPPVRPNSVPHEMHRRALREKPMFVDKERWRFEAAYRATSPRAWIASRKFSIALAVVASCSIPSIFAPVKVRDPTTNRWEWPSWWDGIYYAVDGGVGDNQGIQFLVNGHCRNILVSDAAMALRTQPKPSTWQMLPPGGGIVFRSQDIIYDRMRDWGYRCLEERYEYYRLLSDAGGMEEAERRKAPILQGFAFIELWPSHAFGWQNRPRMSDKLHPALAYIRTDLDRFTNVEISALMYHGYTSIDHCLASYQPYWLPDQLPPLKFGSAIAEINRDWAGMSPEVLQNHLRYLIGSTHRFRFKRWLRRHVSRWIGDSVPGVYAPR